MGCFYLRAKPEPSDQASARERKKNNNRKRRRRKKRSESKVHNGHDDVHHVTDGAAPEIRSFGYDEVEAATSNFHPSTLLGRGSHGSVFRAALEGGRLIAAAKVISSHAPSSDEQPLHNEIEIMYAVRGPHVVNLLGCTPPHPDHQHQPSVAVVELMPNGSLYDNLHINAAALSWPSRVRLALQAAEAVSELHSLRPPVIHRDIKSSNVLLDAQGNARLADFGLAFRSATEHSCPSSTSCCSSPPLPAGTLGYLDPAYIVPADLSNKTDVFSFGVLLLEILSGRKAIDVEYSPPSLLDWAVPLITTGNFDAIWDPRAGGEPRPRGRLLRTLKEVAVLAASCVGPVAAERPDMAEVARCLRNVNRAIAAKPSWWRKASWEQFARDTSGSGGNSTDVG